jgi:hypothetical protein
MFPLICESFLYANTEFSTLQYFLSHYPLPLLMQIQPSMKDDPYEGVAAPALIALEVNELLLREFPSSSSTII